MQRGETQPEYTREKEEERKRERERPRRSVLNKIIARRGGSSAGFSIAERSREAVKRQTKGSEHVERWDYSV